MKKIIGSFLISASVIGFSIEANAEMASDVTTDKNTGIPNHVISGANITVKPGEEKPTEPEDPNKPSGETAQNGPLSIDNVIVFNFQDMNLKGITQQISLKNDGVESEAKRNVQVTDTRGTGAGWNLQIKQSELTDATSTTGTLKILKGAYIKLSNGEIVAGNDNVSDTFPELNKTYDASSNKGDFQKLIIAQKGTGLGTFKLKYNQNERTDDIQLVVPSGSMIGNYKGTVTWALSDSPTGTPAS